MPNPVVRTLFSLTAVPAAFCTTLIAEPTEARAAEVTFQVRDDGATSSTCIQSSNFASEEVGYGNFLGLPPPPCSPDLTITDNREHAQQALSTFDLTDLSAPGGMYWLLDWDSMQVVVWAKQQLNEVRHLGFCWTDDQIDANTDWSTWPVQGWRLPAGAPGCAQGTYTQTFIPGGQIGALHWGTQAVPLGVGQLALFQQSALAAYNLGGGEFSMTMFIGTPGVPSGQLNIGDALISLENVSYTCGPGTPDGPCPQGPTNPPEATKMVFDAEAVECLEDGHCTSQDPNTGKVCWADAVCDDNVCISGSALPDTVECDEDVFCDGVNPDCPDLDLGFCAEEFNWDGGSEGPWGSSSIVNWQGAVYQCRADGAGAFCQFGWTPPGGFWSNIFSPDLWAPTGETCAYEPCPPAMPDAWEYMGGYGYGDLVVGTDGETYECKAEPYTPWCEQRQPITGLGWADAWKRVEGCTY